MYVEEVIIDGFKSYSMRTTVGPFDSQFTAITVKTLDELEPALERAFANKHELVFLDVKVDPHEHVYPMQVPLGAMRDMLLSKTERT